MRLSKYVSIFLLIFCSSIAYGQISIAETPIEKIDGEKFYLHIVQKGHTLYSIGKAYHSDIKSITQNNPDATDGLRIGQTLKIPYKKETKENKSEFVPKVENGNLIHKIEDGETLFGISRKYNVDVTEILENNDSAAYGLKPGMKLIIPTKEIETENKVYIKPAVPDSFINHQIQKKETLYSISKQYDVKIEQIEKVNHNISDGLREGSILRIPTFKESYVKAKQKLKSQKDSIAELLRQGYIPKDTIEFKDTYRINMMLPFYLDMNDTLESRRKENQDKKIYGKSRISLDFYKGFMLAVDSLSGLESNFEIKIFDTQNDLNKIQRYIEQGELEQSNLIIGPLYRTNFDIVSDYCSKRHINQICPVPQSNKILLGKEQVTKLSPSLPVHVRTIMSYVLENYNDTHKIILLDNRRVRDEVLFKTAKGLSDAFSIANMDSISRDTIFHTRIYDIDTGSIKSLFRKDTSYALFVPTSDQVYITELMTTINEFVKDRNITVFGLEPWQKFDNIEIEYFNGLNLHFTNSQYIDYNHYSIQRIQKLYRKKYFTDPAKYSFMGFYTGIYFLNALHKKGIYFSESYNELELENIPFDFFKTSLESGYENQFINILRFDDFQLKRVR